MKRLGSSQTATSFILVLISRRYIEIQQVLPSFFFPFIISYELIYASRLLLLIVSNEFLCYVRCTIEITLR